MSVREVDLKAVEKNRFLKLFEIVYQLSTCNPTVKFWSYTPSIQFEFSVNKNPRLVIKQGLGK